MVQPNIMAQLWRHTVWIWIPLAELSSLVLLSHRLLSYTVATLTVPFPLGLLGFSELPHVASWNSSRHVVGMKHMRGPNRHLPPLSAACPSPASFFFFCLHRAVRRLIPFCWVLIPSLIRAFSLLGMQDSQAHLLLFTKKAPRCLEGSSPDALLLPSVCLLCVRTLSFPHHPLVALRPNRLIHILRVSYMITASPSFLCSLRPIYHPQLVSLLC